MPVSDLHRRVASVALQAAAGHGFALGGGNALLAHGVIARPTQDVDLFTDHEHGVEAAAGGVEAALRAAGFSTDRQDEVAELADIFPGMGEGLAEWIITDPDGGELTLQMAFFDRAAGVFTPAHQEYWAAARRTLGDAAGTKALIEILLGHRTLPAHALTAAMTSAVSSGVLDPQLVLIDARRHAAGPVAPVIPIGSLARYDRPAPALGPYDDLLTRSAR